MMAPDLTLVTTVEKLASGYALIHVDASSPCWVVSLPVRTRAAIAAIFASYTEVAMLPS